MAVSDGMHNTDAACFSIRQCSIPKKDGKKVIDDMWLYTILAMIGENFEAGHELCGAVIRSDLACLILDVGISGRCKGAVALPGGIPRRGFCLHPRPDRPW